MSRNLAITIVILLMSMLTAACWGSPATAPATPSISTPSSPSPRESAPSRTATPTGSPRSFPPRGQAFREYPLEGKVIFNISERNGAFSIAMKTQKTTYDTAYKIKADLTIKDSQMLIDLPYIQIPFYQYAMEGPATATVVLGRIGGDYELSFSHDGTLDHYKLTVSVERISVSPGDGGFTMPLHNVWRRLSSDTIWFNTRYRESTYRWLTPLKPMDKQEYQAFVERFFAKVEALGAKRFVPEGGFYPYVGFIPPWPDKQTVEKEFVTIVDPDDPNALMGGYRLDMRFFHYAGQLDNVVRLLEQEYADGTTHLSVHFFNTEKMLYPRS